MSITASQPLPSTRQLLKATVVAMGVASTLLVTTILPAEYGIDPTGIGSRLGLNVLASTAKAAELDAPPPAPTGNASAKDAANAALASKAIVAFGKSDGQSLDAGAVSIAGGTLRQDTLTVTLPPGKGAEVKAHMQAGAGLVFRWSASADVAVDMHGERTDVKNAWTSYAVESAQREAGGTFVAPFEGTHGWYWKNRGTQPITVEVAVTGFQQDLYKP